MSCVVGVWLVELPSSSIMYWKVPRLMIVKKTNNRLTQAVVFFRRHFLCGALLCNCSPAEREVYLHMYNGNVSKTLHAQLNISPRFSPTIFFIAMRIQYLLALSTEDGGPYVVATWYVVSIVCSSCVPLNSNTNTSSHSPRGTEGPQAPASGALV